MKTNKRDIRLDLLRIFSITLIAFMHSPRPGNVQGYVLSGLSYVTMPGLVLFFMISGALLLGSGMSTKAFLKRRLSKVVFPTLFWTISTWYILLFLVIALILKS